MDRITSRRRSDNMRNIRAADTTPEMTVRRLVHAMGFRYRLHVQQLPGRPDLVFPRLKKIIQVHGCFWHQHEICGQARIPKSRTEYWETKLRRNAERDKKNEEKLIDLGWSVLTLWACELADRDALAGRLRQFLKPTPTPKPAQRQAAPEAPRKGSPPPPP
jgi:DNA mismatch endonuclease (patch repair protein)